MSDLLAAALAYYETGGADVEGIWEDIPEIKVGDKVARFKLAHFSAETEAFQKELMELTKDAPRDPDEPSQAMLSIEQRKELGLRIFCTIAVRDWNLTEKYDPEECYKLLRKLPLLESRLVNIARKFERYRKHRVESSSKN